jgi:hypothetical protein
LIERSVRAGGASLNERVTVRRLHLSARVYLLDTDGKSFEIADEANV